MASTQGVRIDLRKTGPQDTGEVTTPPGRRRWRSAWTTRATRADPDRDGISEPGEEADLVTGFGNATGGAGPEWLVAPGTGVNVLVGRGGDDFLDVRDGSTARDTANCSTGADTYRRDASDGRLYCETEVAR